MTPGRHPDSGPMAGVTSLELWHSASAQVGQVVDAQTSGDLRRPLTAGCEEAAQQPATSELVDEGLRPCWSVPSKDRRTERGCFSLWRMGVWNST